MDNFNVGDTIRNLRKKKKMTIKDLAEKAKITSSMLSQIERGLANPSINTLRELTDCLQIPLYKFFQTNTSQGGEIVRSTERKVIGLPGNETFYELLTPDTKGEIEFCIMHVPGRSCSEDKSRAHEGEENSFVIKGPILIEVDGIEYRLETGDSLRIPAHTKHRWINPTGETAKVIFAITPPSF